MPQSYTEGGDSLQSLGGVYYAGQTFTPQTSFTLHWIDINLRNYHPTRSPTVWLYLAGEDHKPIGDYLSKTIRCHSENWNIYNVFRMRAEMTPVDLTADTEYVIVIHSFALDLDWRQSWQFDALDATYGRGMRLRSTDYGVTWTPFPNDDHIFAQFGTPPAPEPPPEPPVYNWAILDIVQTVTATGYKFVVTTNVPCHLFMYWTNQEPEKHKRTTILRGLIVPAASQLCFVTWHMNEQAEEGDTIFHTFIKEPWPHCETRWFTFRARIDIDWSPSVGPIFKKHRVAPPWGPEQEDTFLADTDDGYLATWFGSPFNTYLQNWEAAASGVFDFETAASLYNNNFNNQIHIYRGVLFFNTTTLPETHLIVSAYVRLQTLGTANPRDALLCLTPATNVHKPLIATDYHALLDTPTIIASHPLEDIVIPPGMILNLTEEGLTHITKAGFTKFGTRISFEIDANGCPTGAEGIRYRTQEGAPISVRPVLVVTSRPPA